jgi:hypothetical protein
MELAIYIVSRALFRAARTFEQVRFKETTTSEKFYASIKYDFGITYSAVGYKTLFCYEPEFLILPIDLVFILMGNYPLIHILRLFTTALPPRRGCF